MNRFWKIYGLLNLVAAFLLLVSCFHRLHGFCVVPSYPAGFIAIALDVIPFVVTYSKLGLNAPEGLPLGGESTRIYEATMATSRRNQEKLARIFPWWKRVWSGSLIFVGICWVWWLIGESIAPGNRYSPDPFIVFFVMLALLTGFWFSVAHPRAKAVLPEAD